MKYPEMNELTKQYWTSEDFDTLRNAKAMTEVFAVASSILSRMPDTLAQVCGPVSSGGKGNIEDNLEYLSSCIDELQKGGLYIFDQMPFEETFHRIIREEAEQQKYTNILTDFYEPLFNIGKIKTLYFIPGWESSRGANWEHDKALELGMEIKFI